MAKLGKFGWLIGILTLLEYGVFVGFFAFVVLNPSINTADFPIVTTLSTAMLVHALICGLLGTGTAASIQGELETSLSKVIPYGLLTAMLALPVSLVVPGLMVFIGDWMTRAKIELNYLIYLLGALAIAGYFLGLVGSSMFSASMAKRAFGNSEDRVE